MNSNEIFKYDLIVIWEIYEFYNIQFTKFNILAHKEKHFSLQNVHENQKK